MAKDLVEAQRWFQKASDLGVVQGNFMLGFMKVCKWVMALARNNIILF